MNTLSRMLILLYDQYWEQCKFGRPTVELVSDGKEPDDVRKIHVGYGAPGDELCFVCQREQYGVLEDCGIPCDRDDWRLEL